MVEVCRIYDRVIVCFLPAGAGGGGGEEEEKKKIRPTGVCWSYVITGERGSVSSSLTSRQTWIFVHNPRQSWWCWRCRWCWGVGGWKGVGSGDAWGVEEGVVLISTDTDHLYPYPQKYYLHTPTPLWRYTDGTHPGPQTWRDLRQDLKKIIYLLIPRA